jgi:nucleoside-diphosphate-sugar epimerase
VKVSGVPDVVVWGTGTPRREFLYVADMADACVHLMNTYSSDQTAKRFNLTGICQASRSELILP